MPILLLGGVYIVIIAARFLLPPPPPLPPPPLPLHPPPIPPLSPLFLIVSASVLLSPVTQGHCASNFVFLQGFFVCDSLAIIFH